MSGVVATRLPFVYLVRTLCLGCCGARELATSDWLLPRELSHSIGFLSELAVGLSQNSRKGDSIFKFVKDWIFYKFVLDKSAKCRRYVFLNHYSFY